jgi:hypothetical protein
MIHSATRTNTAGSRNRLARTTAPWAAMRATLRRPDGRRGVQRRLRRELALYRTPAERAEIEAIYARHDAALPATFHRP